MRFLSIEPLLEDLGDLDLTGIDWVIVGGESGPGARPMRGVGASIREPVRPRGVPFFFKQWGGRCRSTRRTENEGRTYDQFPVTPTNDPTARPHAWIAGLAPTTCRKIQPGQRS